MLNKNEHHEMTIDDIGSSGEGIGRIDGFTLFVEGALPGDTIEARIVKLKKNYGYGKLIKMIKPSKNRVEPVCPVFGKCGGCSLQHLDYQAQLGYKQKKVTANLERIGGLSDIDVLPLIGMDNPYYYRNKAQFPMGVVGGETVCGFYEKRSHAVVPVQKCFIQHPITADVLRIVKNFMTENNIKPYDEITHTGLVRHVLVKVGFTTGDIMVCLVINGNKLYKSDVLVNALIPLKGMSCICVNVNKEKGNVILGSHTETLWGIPTITDLIGDLSFQISPLSFFQVNPVQTEILYEKCVEFAQIRKTDVIFDAYCGIGTISLFMAKHAKHVYGVEIVKQAIDDAKQNALLNGIDNVTFLVGKAEAVIPELSQKNGVTPDIIVVDPPRAGCEATLLQTMLDIQPEKIIYISCDSATLARDLKVLCQADYSVSAMQPVDCFPMTTHVECCCLLTRK